MDASRHRDRIWIAVSCGLPLLIFVPGFILGLATADASWAIVATVAGAVGMLLCIAGLIFRAPSVGLFGTAAVISGGLGAAGFAQAGSMEAMPLIAAGGLGLLLTVLGLAIWHRLAATAGTPSTDQVSPAPAASATHSDDAVSLLRDIHTHTMLSDNAKRVLFRDRELQMLRRVIEEDISRGDYDAALILCDAMAELFGFREEAEEFRTRIEQARAAEYDTQVQMAIDGLTELLEQRDWATAHREAARIRRLYPDSHLVRDLDQRIARARDEHKSELEHQFLHAANHEDVELAMRLLRELDKYLTPDEAGRLAEVAQGVVVKHRENLGVQFKLAVSNREWTEAVDVGETIVNEFPNSKMADEVRSMIDALRTRATHSPVAQPGTA